MFSLTKVNCVVSNQRLFRDPSKLHQYIYCRQEPFCSLLFYYYILHVMSSSTRSHV